MTPVTIGSVEEKEGTSPPSEIGTSKGTGQAAPLPDETMLQLGRVSLRVIADDCVSENDLSNALGTFHIDGRRYMIIGAAPPTKAASSPIDLLTKRELQIALLVADGKVNKQIAYRLKISPYTVSSYLKRIFCKLHCHTRAEMATLIVNKLSTRKIATLTEPSPREEIEA